MTQDVLLAVENGASDKSPKPEKSSRAARVNHTGSKRPDSNRSCPLCKRKHFIAYCDTYKKKSGIR